MASSLKDILVARVKNHWNTDSKYFDQDFADHIVGAAVEFYQNESWEKFGVFTFSIYPIPAKTREDAIKIVVRVYDIWEPKEVQHG